MEAKRYGTRELELTFDGGGYLNLEVGTDGGVRLRSRKVRPVVGSGSLYIPAAEAPDALAAIQAWIESL